MDKSDYVPMSDALVNRMEKVLNAAITGMPGIGNWGRRWPASYLVLLTKTLLGLLSLLLPLLHFDRVGYLFIPFFAAFMSRGIAHVDGFPAVAGIALTLLATGGASFLYGKQSLTWEEPAGTLVDGESS